MTAAIIVAAGRGTRMGPDIDKLFLQLAGAPVIAHTWRRMDAAPVDEIILVVRDGWQEAFALIARELPLQRPWRCVIGGRERQDSVWNGLEAVTPGTTLVAIHDGARPATSPELFQRCLAAAVRAGASVAAQPAIDTIKESADGTQISRHLDRTKLWTVQTPQCFRLEVIRRALQEVRSRGLTVTDDTAACELIGQSVELVKDSSPNPKVTSRSDLALIELLLRAS